MSHLQKKKFLYIPVQESKSYSFIGRYTDELDSFFLVTLLFCRGWIHLRKFIFRGKTNLCVILMQLLYNTCASLILLLKVYNEGERARERKHYVYHFKLNCFFWEEDHGRRQLYHGSQFDDNHVQQPDRSYRFAP